MTLCSSHRLRTATAAVTHVAVGFSEWWLWNNTLNSKPDRGQKLELPLCEPKLNLMKRRISQLSLCLYFFFFTKVASLTLKLHIIAYFYLDLIKSSSFYVYITLYRLSVFLCLCTWPSSVPMKILIPLRTSVRATFRFKNIQISG